MTEPSEKCKHPYVIDRVCPACGESWGKVIAALREDLHEQCRLLGKSGEREAGLLAKIAQLEDDRDSWKKKYETEYEIAKSAVNDMDVAESSASALAEKLKEKEKGVHREGCIRTITRSTLTATEDICNEKGIFKP